MMENTVAVGLEETRDFLVGLHGDPEMDTILLAIDAQTTRLRGEAATVRKQAKALENVVHVSNALLHTLMDAGQEAQAEVLALALGITWDDFMAERILRTMAVPRTRGTGTGGKAAFELLNAAGCGSTYSSAYAAMESVARTTGVHSAYHNDANRFDSKRFKAACCTETANGLRVSIGQEIFTIRKVA
jgi:hypothetical protein